MKKKFRKLLSEKCKDMGLTDKALDDLVEIGAEGLADDASDEDIAAKVDSLVPYAKAMQGEITRKTQRPKPQSKKPQSNDEGEDEGGNEDEAPEWFKPFQKKLTDLETENAALKAEKAKTTRQAEISAKAKKLGIPRLPDEASLIRRGCRPRQGAGGLQAGVSHQQPHAQGAGA